MNTIIKLYYTVQSDNKPPTVTTFPVYKALNPRKTKGMFIFNTGNTLLEGFYQLIYNTSDPFMLAFK